MRTGIVIVVLVAAAAAAALWWMASGPGPGNVLPAESAAGLDPPPTAADALAIDAADHRDPAAAASADPADREEIGTAAAAAARMISGRAVDGDGKPVAGAEVRVRAIDATDSQRDPDAERAANGTTSDEGRFRLALPEAGQENLFLRVSKRGYVPVRERLSDRGEATIDLGDLTLERGVLVAGRVVDSFGQGIAGATVRGRMAPQRGGVDAVVFALPWSRGFTGGGDPTTTGTDGGFELTLPDVGEFEVRAEHARYPPATQHGKAINRGETVAGVLVTLPTGASIDGRVAALPADMAVEVQARAQPHSDGSAPANPLAGLVLSFGGASRGERSIEPAADGAFTLVGLEADRDYELWLAPKADDPFGGLFRASRCSETVTVKAGARGVVITYDPGVKVSFRVVDAETGAPLTALRVESGIARQVDFGGFKMPMLTPQAHPQQEFADGRVTLEPLYPDDDERKLQLQVAAVGYTTATRAEIALPRRGNLDLGVVTLQPASVLAVQVTEASSGAPVAGARVSLTVEKDERGGGSSGVTVSRQVSVRRTGGTFVSTHASLGDSDRVHRAQTDADGRCELTGFPGQDARLAVESDGHAPYRSAPMALPLRGRSESAVALAIGGEIRVTVVDSRGAPVDDRQVSRRGPDDADSQTAQTDARGAVTFRHAAPGVHHLRVLPPRRGAGFAVRMSRGEQSDDKDKEEWTEVHVADGEPLDLRLEVPALGVIVGTVTASGLPLEGARVRLVPGRGEDVRGIPAEVAMRAGFGAPFGGRRQGTDSAGRFRIDEAPVGEHRLEISHPDRALATMVPVTVTVGDNRCDVELGGGALGGVVVDAAGEPVVGAAVEVLHAEDAASIDAAFDAFGAIQRLGLAGRGAGVDRTDVEGRFALAGVPAGFEVVVAVRSDAYVAATSAPVRIRDREARSDLRIVLTPGGSLEVSVAGEVDGMLSVSAQRDATVDGAKQARTGFPQGGKVLLKGLRPGTFEVRLLRNGDSLRSRSVVITAGETARAAFDLDR